MTNQVGDMILRKHFHILSLTTPTAQPRDLGFLFTKKLQDVIRR